MPSIGSISGYKLADILAREQLRNKIDNPPNATSGKVLAINQNGLPEWRMFDSVNNTSIKTIPYNYIDDTIYLNASDLESNTIYKSPDGFMNMQIKVQSQTGEFTESLSTIADPVKYLIYCKRDIDNRIILTIGYTIYTFIIGRTPQECSVSLKPYILTTDDLNITNYTPSKDTDPVNKKYVDDAVLENSVLFVEDDLTDPIITASIPTKTSQLFNDSNYVTSEDLDNKITKPLNTGLPGQILSIDKNGNPVWDYGTATNGGSIIMSLSLMDDDTGEPIEYDVSKQYGFILEYEEDDEEE